MPGASSWRTRCPQDYLSIIEEKVEDWSYMKFPYYKKMGYPGGMYRVGPLARLNVADGITTPLASKEFQEFKKLGNGAWWKARYTIITPGSSKGFMPERVKELLQKEEICSTELRVSSSKYNEEGVGVIEAPRGTLIHHYWVDQRHHPQGQHHRGHTTQ